MSNRVGPHGVDPVDGSTLSTRFTSVRVADVGSAVRALMTTRPGGEVGYVFASLDENAYVYWDGACSARGVRDPVPGTCS